MQIVSKREEIRERTVTETLVCDPITPVALQALKNLKQLPCYFKEKTTLMLIMRNRAFTTQDLDFLLQFLSEHTKTVAIPFSPELQEVNSIDNPLMQVILSCCKKGHLPILEWILESLDSFSYEDQEFLIENLPLFVSLAAHIGHIQIIKKLYTLVDRNTSTNRKMQTSLLKLGAFNGNVELIKAIKRLGPVSTEEMRLSLEIAINQGNLTIAEDILDGLTQNESSHTENVERILESCFINAYKNGALETLEWIKEIIQIKDLYAEGILFTTCEGSLETLKWLLAKAELELAPAQIGVAIVKALKKCLSSPISNHHRLAILELLVDKNCPQQGIYIAFLLAVYNNHIELVKLFYEKAMIIKKETGIFIFSQDLMKACISDAQEKNHTEILSILLNHS
jgi:hypothetical protein